MHLLAAYGVNTVFGIPGEHTLELYRGIEQSGVKAVTPRNEQGASFMADGYARVDVCESAIEYPFCRFDSDVGYI